MFQRCVEDKFSLSLSLPNPHAPTVHALRQQTAASSAQNGAQQRSEKGG